MKKRVLKKVTPYCYKRIFDLTMFNKELLKCYGLEPAKYYYIGSSELAINERNSRWKSHVVADYHIDRNVLDFIKKYKMFLEHQSIENARKFENDLIGHYQMLQAINSTISIKDRVFILNSRGSSVKIKNGKVKFKRKLFID